MSYCEDCGSRKRAELCPWCDEESIIADQYRELGESVPPSIRELELIQQLREKRLA